MALASVNKLTRLFETPEERIAAEIEKMKQRCPIVTLDKPEPKPKTEKVTETHPAIVAVEKFRQEWRELAAAGGDDMEEIEVNLEYVIDDIIAILRENI